MKKWNYETKKYEKYTVPDNWKVKLFSTDMNEKINCAACGKSIKFSDGYPSRTIHYKHGLGYTVCQECYTKDIEEERTYDRQTERFD